MDDELDKTPSKGPTATQTPHTPVPSVNMFARPEMSPSGGAYAGVQGPMASFEPPPSRFGYGISTGMSIAPQSAP